MYQINDRVKRIEDRAITAATILQVLPDGIYLIEYDEGGFGFWPESAIEALEE